MARWTPDHVDDFGDSRDFERHDDEPFFENGVMVLCSDCGGSGEGMYDGSRCSTCHGSGEVLVDGDDDTQVQPMTPDRVTTSTGIHIGGAYFAPTEPVSNDAMFFQDLLRNPQRRPTPPFALVLGALVVIAAAAYWLL